ncbi:PaaI family thioesterase [Nocardia sp. CA-135953]|uniref:PaaI family thioesterase n=1 Tax=Nocardia sp. CA-135953 TaxID=3239978 RepID=UPI003D9885D5
MTSDLSDAPRLRGLEICADNRIIFGASVEARLELSALLIAPGRVAVSTPLRGAAAGPLQPVEPIRLSVLADAATGLGILTAEECESCATVELRVDMLGAPAAGATSLQAKGTTLALESGVGMSRADIHDDLGTPIAHAVAIVATGRRRGAPDTEPRAVGAQFDPADIRVSVLDAGECVTTLAPAMSNSAGIVHGGVLMSLAHAAQDAFERTLDGWSRRIRFAVDYLRPVPPRGELRMFSTLERGGRRLRSIRTELVGGDGKVVAVATGIGAIGDRDHGDMTK